MEFNPLLCSHSVRDIPEVAEALLNCPYDVMYAKYFPIGEAVNNLRKYFLEHEEYTHYIYCPDDLVITAPHLDKLREVLDEKDLPILTGVCNVDLGRLKNKLAITKNLPHPTRINELGFGWRHYDWYDNEEVKGVIQVPHSGLACAVIRRDIIESIPFQDDSSFNADSGRFGSCDVMFSNSCIARKIPIYADTDCFMLHMRDEGQIDITIGDGFMKFIKNT